MVRNTSRHFEYTILVNTSAFYQSPEYQVETQNPFVKCTNDYLTSKIWNTVTSATWAFIQKPFYSSAYEFADPFVIAEKYF